jgi:hypothetical protein
MDANIKRLLEIAGVDITQGKASLLAEGTKFKSHEALIKSFMENMKRVREDLENTKGTDDIDDALDYFDSIMKQFQNAEVITDK